MVRPKVKSTVVMVMVALWGGGFLLLVGGCPGVTPQPHGDSGLTGKFVGASRCQQCHPGIHSDWSETLHARAFESLEQLGQQNNSLCLPCHSVGFGEEGGFVNRATTNALAGVGCESCHGAGLDHVRDPLNPMFTPPINVSAESCGTCHQTSIHPHFEDWSLSGHSQVYEGVVSGMLAGTSTVNNCGPCHSGDVFVQNRVLGRPIENDAFVGLEPEDLTPISCAVCHDPHTRTGNAASPDPGRDFQLRFPEVVTFTPVNTIVAATDPTRFNLCGQCHHSRGRTWQDTTRGPHESVQSNVYIGEMPLPVDSPDLVASRLSVHRNTPHQCTTCHMHREVSETDLAPTISGHTFEVNADSCVLCHPSADRALADMEVLQNEVQSRLNMIAARLGAPSTWDYSANGGPDAEGQAALSDAIKQIRFLYHYIIADGSLGMHNPAYVRDMLQRAEALLTSSGL